MDSLALLGAMPDAVKRKILAQVQLQPVSAASPVPTIAAPWLPAFTAMATEKQPDRLISDTARIQAVVLPSLRRFSGLAVIDGFVSAHELKVREGGMQPHCLLPLPLSP